MYSPIGVSGGDAGSMCSFSPGKVFHDAFEGLESVETFQASNGNNRNPRQIPWPFEPCNRIA